MFGIPSGSNLKMTQIQKAYYPGTTDEIIEKKSRWCNENNMEEIAAAIQSIKPEPEQKHFIQGYEWKQNFHMS